MVHFIQRHCTFDIPGFKYCNEFSDKCETVELAAMIVETCERIRQGYTPKMLDDLARAPDFQSAYPDLCHGWDYTAIRDLPHVQYIVEPVLPSMDGYLLYDYCVKYGPKLTGCLACDLDIVKDWVRDFERVGLARFSNEACPGGLARNYEAIVQFELLAHQTNHLASTAQTWLGINGAPSEYPVVPMEYNERHPKDTPDPTLGEVILHLQPVAPDEAFDRACRFVQRYQASGVR
jgi:hypothetical protein